MDRGYASLPVSPMLAAAEGLEMSWVQPET